MEITEIHCKSCGRNQLYFVGKGGYDCRCACGKCGAEYNNSIEQKEEEKDGDSISTIQ